MDPERKSDPHPEPQRPTAPAEALAGAETAPELAAAYIEWLRDRAGDRR